MEDSSAVTEFYRFLEEEELANEQYYQSLDSITAGDIDASLPSATTAAAAASFPSSSRSLLDFSDDDDELEKMSSLMNSSISGHYTIPDTLNTEKLIDICDNDNTAAPTPDPSAEPVFFLAAVEGERGEEEGERGGEEGEGERDSDRKAKVEELLVFNALSNGSLDVSDHIAVEAAITDTSHGRTHHVAEPAAALVNDKIEYNVLDVKGTNSSSIVRTFSSDSRDESDDSGKVTIKNKFKRFTSGQRGEVHSYYINMRRIDIDSSSVGYEIYIRPDVSQNDALTLTKHVLLSLCGAVRTDLSDWGSLPPGVSSNDENKLSVLEVSNGNCAVGGGNGARPLGSKPAEWKDIKCCVGVNLDKVRVLFIHITSQCGFGPTIHPTGSADNSIINKLDPLNIFGINRIIATASSNFSGNLVPASNGAPINVIDLLIDHLLEALYDNHLDITSLLYHSPYDCTSSGSGSGNVQYVLDSILDPLFVRDLQQSAAQEMLLTLTEKASKMDTYLRYVEKQCARMMTVLQPSYTRAELTLPTPPPSTSLTTYKLELPKKPIFDISVDQSKLLILKSRRLVAIRGAYDNDYVGLLNALISAILNHIRSHVEEESAIRLRRRKAYSRDRAAAIERFKAELLTLLDERNANPEQEMAPGDELLLTALHSRCRLLDPRTQACLLDTSNVGHVGRKGSMYVSREYVYFHSNGSLFQSVEMKLVSLKIVRAVAVTVNGKVSVLPLLSSRPGCDIGVARQESSDLYMDDRTSSLLASKIANSNHTSTHSNNDGNSITIVMPNDVFEVFCIAGPTADYCYRIADVINLLLQTRLWERPALPSKEGATPALSALSAQSAASVSASVSAPHVFYCKDATFVGIVEPSPTVVEPSPTVVEPSPTVVEPSPPPQQQQAATAPPMKEALGLGVGVGVGVGVEKKKLAHNIQAFLDKAKTSK